MSQTTAMHEQAAAFVVGLIICRRNIQSYPESHPVVSAALGKTIERFAPLIADDGAFTLGTARQKLMLKNDFLDPANDKFGEFATLLAAFGIITISFTADLRPEELQLFCRIINRPRNEIWEAGGIKHALAATGISAIKVQVIDPSVFSLTDELSPESANKTTDPWEVFVRKLLEGYFSASPERLLQLMSAPPAELAGELEAILAGIPEEARHHSIKALADFFAGLAHRPGSEGLTEDLLDKFGSFISGLSPRLRCDFICNICKSTRTTTGFTERLLLRLPGEAMLEVMHSIASHGENIPEMLLKLLQRLSAHSDSTPALDAAITGGGAEEKVRVLLREAEVEKFIPAAYRETLMAILATDSLPVTATHALDDLRKTVEGDHLEAKIADIISELIKAIPAAERGDGIRRNLMGLTAHYLGTCDFRSLERVCRIILGEAHAMESASLINPGFIQEILDAAALLGREKYQDIQAVIKVVGLPFVVPLMERLFTEENRSLRRFWFDSLGGLGEMVRNAALARLNDDRWFVLRNLIIILRGFSDLEVQRQIRRIAGHPNSKVRIEALKNMLCYNDPIVDRLLIEDLESADRARKLAAVQIAEMSCNPEVTHRLLAILDSGGIADYGLEIKSAAVQALGGGGNVEALPKLKEILFSSSLLHPGKHTQLKIEIIRVLPRFSASQVRPLLEELAAAGGKTLAPIAAEALKGLQRGAS